MCKWVSRRVGGFVWSGPGAGVHVEHPAAERHGPLPLVCYALLPTWRDSRAAGDSPLSGPALGHPGAEACRRHLRLIVSLRISLPCQVLHADLRMAYTVAYRG